MRRREFLGLLGAATALPLAEPAQQSTVPVIGSSSSSPRRPADLKVGSSGGRRSNHRHLMRYATETTPRLMWFNFAHLFSVSLLPLSAAWMAVSELAPQPGCLLCRGLLPGECDLHLFDL
jgi:hypothetical protein